MNLRWEFPLETVSALNQREHHMARHRRVKKERKRAALFMPPEAKAFGPVLIITLTRLAPAELDDGDNLPSALKGVRDQLAAELKVNDRSQLVRWRYAQEPAAEAGVRVEFQANPGPLLARALEQVPPLLPRRDPPRPPGQTGEPGELPGEWVHRWPRYTPPPLKPRVTPNVVPPRKP